MTRILRNCNTKCSIMMTRMMSTYSASILLLVATCIMTMTTTTILAVTAMTDTATGISFVPKKNGLELFGVGVRKKGPIKVYSVAMYGSSQLKESLSTISGTSSKRLALDTIKTGSKEPEPTATFVLQMSLKVGAEKMAKAISDSIKPRYYTTGESSTDIDQLQSCLTDGLGKTGATKGTTLQFDCSTNGINIVINGKSHGTIQSQNLAKAFCDVYLDDNCVSPALRDNCIKNCCLP